MNKKKLFIGTLASAGLLLAACETDSAENNNDVAFTINGEKMSSDEFYDILKNEPMGGATYGEQQAQQYIVAQLLEEEYGDLVSEEEVEEYYEETAVEYGGVEELNVILEEEGLTQEFLMNELRLSLLMERAIESQVEVTDEALQELHNEQIPVGSRVRHILVEDEELAQDIIEQLNDGADFVELVEEHSTDEGPDGNGEYDLIAGQFLPEFEEVARSLDAGELHQEPVETLYGYHVIEMVEWGEAEDFEDVRDELEEQYLAREVENSPELGQSIVIELIEDADIEFNDEELSGALDSILNAPELPEEEVPFDEEMYEDVQPDEPMEDEDSDE